MTPRQEEHLQRIKDYFSDTVDPKYRKGQEEHGGNLFDMSAIQLIDSSIEEAIDLVVYLTTLRDKVVKGRKISIGVGP